MGTNPGTGSSNDHKAIDEPSPMTGRRESAAGTPPFHFIVAFWGKEHRDYFLQLCLPSLLSPNNVPSLENPEDSRVVIATTRWDWMMIRRHPAFALMEKHIKAHPIFIPRPWLRQRKKMLVMSNCQRLASMKAFEDRAIGVFLAPDVILSDGSVRSLQRLEKEGWKVVLTAVVRFSSERCIPEIEQRHGLRPGQPISLSPRQLTDIVLRNLHSETERYRWDSPYFASNPITCMFDGPDDDGFLVHTFSWAPLLLDYSAIDEHDTSTFEKWTLDGDYVHRNFPDERDVYVVTDSDEIILASFTSEEELHFELVNCDPLEGSKAQETKIRLLRRLFFNDVMDPLKRKIFTIPVHWHTKDLTPEWEPVKERSAGLIREAVSERPTEDDEALYHHIQGLQAGDVSFLQKLIHLDYRGLYRLYIRGPFVLYSRKPLVYFYICFRRFLKPVVDWLKESELGFRIVVALRGWDDDVVPPGYLLRRKEEEKAKHASNPTSAGET